jgi:hypothetical protein
VRSALFLLGAQVQIGGTIWTLCTFRGARSGETGTPNVKMTPPSVLPNKFGRVAPLWSEERHGFEIIVRQQPAPCRAPSTDTPRRRSGACRRREGYL